MQEGGSLGGPVRSCEPVKAAGGEGRDNSLLALYPLPRFRKISSMVDTGVSSGGDAVFGGHSQQGHVPAPADLRVKLVCFSSPPLGFVFSPKQDQTHRNTRL